MNPIVEAALIAGGTTAIVGVAGLLTTLAVMRRTLDAARDDRLWDKRSAAYEVALAELANRHFGRERAGHRLEQYPRVMPEGFAEYFATYDTLHGSKRRAGCWPIPHRRSGMRSGPYDRPTPPAQRLSTASGKP